MKRIFESWGRYPKEAHTVLPVSSMSKLQELPDWKTVLPFGLGRSYGDSCLNDGHILLDVAPLSYFL